MSASIHTPYYSKATITAGFRHEDYLVLETSIHGAGSAGRIRWLREMVSRVHVPRPTA